MKLNAFCLIKIIEKEAPFPKKNIGCQVWEGQIGKYGGFITCNFLQDENSCQIQKTPTSREREIVLYIRRTCKNDIGVTFINEALMKLHWLFIFFPFFPSPEIRCS